MYARDPSQAERNEAFNTCVKKPLPGSTHPEGLSSAVQFRAERCETRLEHPGPGLGRRAPRQHGEAVGSLWCFAKPQNFRLLTAGQQHQRDRPRAPNISLRALFPGAFGSSKRLLVVVRFPRTCVAAKVQLQGDHSSHARVWHSNVVTGGVTQTSSLQTVCFWHPVRGPEYLNGNGKPESDLALKSQGLPYLLQAIALLTRRMILCVGSSKDMGQRSGRSLQRS